MFRHFLLPTDGSALSYKAIQAAMALAKQTGARVTGYYALPMRHLPAGANELDREMDAHYARRAREEADTSLGVIRDEAARQGVPCTVTLSADTPDCGIIKTAMERECDLIFMASHGRTGLPAQMLGSVTQKVISLASIPVLVFRAW